MGLAQTRVKVGFPWRNEGAGRVMRWRERVNGYRGDFSLEIMHSVAYNDLRCGKQTVVVPAEPGSRPREEGVVLERTLWRGCTP